MTFLEGAALAAIMIGSTHYVDVGKGKDAVIYYASPTVAHMTLPDVRTWTGELRLEAGGYFVKWAGGPAGNWKIARETGRFTYIDPKGSPAGTISKIVPGNPENF